MNVDIRPALGKGVRLRHDTDGGAMLLIPEGALMLNRTAAAALELVDGRRTIADIAAALTAAFDVDEACLRDDVTELFDRLAERRLVIL
jgi:pyrroloquinoline quinone biosynthesis protein D